MGYIYDENGITVCPSCGSVYDEAVGFGQEVHCPCCNVVYRFQIMPSKTEAEKPQEENAK